MQPAHLYLLTTILSTTVSYLVLRKRRPRTRPLRNVFSTAGGAGVKSRSGGANVSRFPDPYAAESAIPRVSRRRADNDLF